MIALRSFSYYKDCLFKDMCLLISYMTKSQQFVIPYTNKGLKLYFYQTHRRTVYHCIKKRHWSYIYNKKREGYNIIADDKISKEKKKKLKASMH